ncbi:uncharacterized protein IL334_000875 [Kwoniella shivajii]|uniref:NADH:ubiquinone oxidoreductase intermediate-associated protein 30 domain-containing protein n=1 Tax=Kwoniella shivajii TaxID=564305 RepID=A0ABZ1CQK1_9TREE|nr:hypothetical protein IL334_000875 [Kwoniella shivajii]
MPKHTPEVKTLFPAWRFDHWRAVDDRVRGGSSISHLDEIELDSKVNLPLNEDETLEKGNKNIGARFWGTLDINTLGGAGFASQSYRYGPPPLELPRISYSGVSVTYLPDPQTKYTSSTPRDFVLVLKPNPTAQIPKHPKTPGSPREAQLTYEANFSLSSFYLDNSHKEKKVEFGWNQFEPTYRGRNIPEGDPKWVPLDPKAIFELSIMCRSDFGKQQGEFGVVITSIQAIKTKTSVGIWSNIIEWWNGFSTYVGRFFGWNRITLDEVDDEEKRLIA